MMLIDRFLTLATTLIPPLYASKNRALKEKTGVVIMLGPPGAGKGTQAAMLRNHLNIPHISTGDLLRENNQKRTELGEKAKGYMNRGELVPDELILDMLFERVSHKDCQMGYILDGFPRTLVQAEAFQKRVGRGSKLIAINLEISDEKIIDRLVKRVVCLSCGASYHLLYLPPKEEMTCDDCGKVLIERSDDREDVVRERLRVYHEQTRPLIDYYSKQGKLKCVPCIESKEKIAEKILSILQSIDYQ